MAGSTESFDVHEYRKLAAQTNTDTFKDWIRIYEKQYLAPLPMLWASSMMLDNVVAGVVVKFNFI